jgi:hypothetical protein
MNETKHYEHGEARLWELLQQERADNERLRVLLTECGNFIVTGTDEGCEPDGCAECDMHRLRLRIDAALAGAAVQPDGATEEKP